MRTFRYIPFSQVFPRTAAVVHHGGIGTTGQGLAGGVPQLIMPMGFDQPDNAARLERLGVGAALYPRQFTGVNVAARLAALLEPAVRRRCQDVARRFENHAARERACEQIEQVRNLRARVEMR
jgi:rhamnosyltransferase subunit B